jgi:hypothetical protein
MTNAVVAWNAVYMATSINQMKAESYPSLRQIYYTYQPQVTNINFYGIYVALNRTFRSNATTTPQ